MCSSQSIRAYAVVSVVLPPSALTSFALAVECIQGTRLAASQPAGHMELLQIRPVPFCPKQMPNSHMQTSECAKVLLDVFLMSPKAGPGTSGTQPRQVQ